MPKKTTNVGTAIRKFRIQCGMTQRVFAEALGIAPGSIYRYEVGSSIPDIAILRRLLTYAIKRDIPSAQIAFSNEIQDRTGLGDPTAEDEARAKQTPAWPAAALLANTRWLSRSENVLVLAFAKMLKNSSDSTAHEVIRLLLKPWMAEAIADKEAYGDEEPPELLALTKDPAQTPPDRKQRSKE